MIDPHMLEHADRDNTIIETGFMTVIKKLEPDPIRDTRLRSAALCSGILLGGEGQPGDVSAKFRQIESKPSPPGADIEHPESRLQKELGCYMTLLAGLRLFKRVIGIEKISA